MPALRQVDYVLSSHVLSYPDLIMRYMLDAGARSKYRNREIPKVQISQSHLNIHHFVAVYGVALYQSNC
jgi:hypothetical protein